MSLLKYIERLKRMDDLIQRKATGGSEEFAQKLGISKSQLFENLRELKQLGAPVEYCTFRKSYFYKNEGSIIINFVSEGQNVKGGKNNFFLFQYSSITGVPEYTFKT